MSQGIPANPPVPLIAVFSGGDALDPRNYPTRARVAKASALAVEYGEAATEVLFIGNHPAMSAKVNASEAATMWENYRNSGGKAPCIVNEAARDCDETCDVLVAAYLSRGRPVHVVINWTYMWRVKYLLRRRVRQHGLEWNSVRHLVHYHSCGGTFMPFVREKGLAQATVLWILRNPAREACSWFIIAFPGVGALVKDAAYRVFYRPVPPSKPAGNP